MPVDSLPAHLHLLAKAPLPGHAKTRLIPALGPQGAADAHATMVRHCVATACEATGASRSRSGPRWSIITRCFWSCRRSMALPWRPSSLATWACAFVGH